jgi:hypothetical protein
MKFTQLVAAVEHINGASFIGLDTLTEVKLKGGKSNPMQGKVTKKTVGSNIIVFTNTNSNGYEDMVQRRLVAEGKDPTSFSVGERKWGTRIPNMPLIEHFKDDVTKYYLDCIFLKSGKSTYFLEGREIAKEDIQGLEDKEEKEPDPEKPIEETAQAGLSNKVIVRTISADSILELRVDGRVFN